MDFRRLFDIFPYQQSKYPKKIALAHKKGLKWQTYSTEACMQHINSVSAGLLDLGLKKGDKIGIMTHGGSPQWNFLDIGALQIGIVVVPIHAVISDEDLEFILNNAEVKYCIVSNRELYQRVANAKDNAKGLKQIYTLEKLPDIPGWEELISVPNEKHFEAFQGFKAAIHEDDLATIIYTSGTTGVPKGVMLSHKNIISNIKATITLLPINCDKRTVSFLPMSHIFERMVTYTYMAVGASLYYGDTRETISETIQEVRPHYFTAVPRLLEKLHDDILERAAERSTFSRKIIHWAIKLGKRYKGRKAMPLGYWFKSIFADVLIYRKWRKALGGKVEGVVVGAAPLLPDLGRLFSAAGIEIREGYGLTETAPVISFNRFEPGGVRFGTVGIPIPGVELKIDAPNEEGEGEIVVKGPNVMLGYHKNEEQTKAVLDAEGWFRTGDIGKIVHKRFLQITDRKKDIFKTSVGKYIAPLSIENHLKTSIYIEQVVVIGYGRPFITALIYPSFSMLKTWCKDNNVHWTAPQYMVINPKVIELFKGEMEQLNTKLQSFQCIKDFHLFFQELTEETGELTATLKLKRAAIQKRFTKEIEEMYTK